MRGTTIIKTARDADIHRQTAAEIFGIDPGAVTSSQRVAARALNFGIIYGSREGMTHKARRMESMIAGYRAMYSDMYASYQRFSETADDPDPMIQFERRMLRQQWVWEETQRQRLRMPSPVVLAALAGFGVV